ncbi:lipoprotein [Vibrio phage D480]|nr:putative band 7 protein [Vibrio phage 6E35.1a]
MIKKIAKLLSVAALGLALVGCGTPAEIPTGYVGKIQTKDGFDASAQPRGPSKFRLDWAWRYPDRLVMLDVSDSFYEMNFNTFMPKDELMLKYDIEMTMAMNPKKYNFVFTKVPFKSLADQVGVIEQKAVFERYARAKLNTIIPSIIAEYSIAEVASTRQKLNEFVKQRLNQELADTPFVIKVVGVTDVVYPDTITDAQIKSAERRQQEDTVNAQRKLDLLTIKTREEVSKKEREIELYEAETKKLVADKLMNDNVRFLEEQKTLRMMAQGTNKVFVPSGMIDNLNLTSQVK